MLPKKIHYCWFGGKEKPEDVKKYIASWKKYFPDYEIKEWNESKFDIHENDYCQEAYEAKKWAFVTDYVRLKALYEEGGFYMDTDLQLVVNDGLKMILGVTGCCLALIFLYKLLPYMRETSLYHLAAREGQYTLDIYLIQIIVIEKLLGPFYKQLVSQSGINWVNEYGLIVKVVSTLVLAAILLGIVMGISRLYHKNQYVSKILFWKS